MRPHLLCGTLAALVMFGLVVRAEDEYSREAALVGEWEAYYQSLEAIAKIDAGELTSFCVSREGKYLAGGGAGGKLRLWDADLKELRSIDAHKGRILDTQFSTDGGMVATAGEDGVVAVFDVATGENKARNTHSTKEARALAFTADGERIVSGDAGGVLALWSWRTDQFRKLKTAKAGITCLALTTDGKAVTYATEDGDHATESLENANDWRFFGFGWSSSPYRQILHTPGGGHRVTVSDWGVQFDELNGDLDGSMFSGREPSRVAISANGRFAVVGSMRGELAVVPLRFDRRRDLGNAHAINSLKTCVTLDGLEDRVVGAGFSADGAVLFGADRAGKVIGFKGKKPVPAAFEGNSPRPRSAELPPVPHYRFVHTNALAQQWETYYCGFSAVANSGFELGEVNCVEFSRLDDELLLATDKGAYAYDVSLARQITRYGAADMRAVAARYALNGNAVLVAGQDGGLFLFDRASGAAIQTFRKADSHYTCLAVSPDGSRFATGNEAGEVLVWDFQQAEPVKKLRAERMRFPRDEDEKDAPDSKSAVSAVAWLRDGKVLRAGTATGSEISWETRDWMNNQSGWSSDSSPVYVLDETPGGDLDVSARHGLRFAPITRKLDDAVVHVNFNATCYRTAPSGRFAVFGGDNGHTYLLPLAFRPYVEPEDRGNGIRGKSISSLDPIARFEGLGGSVRAVSFNSDGSRFAACSSSGRVAVFGSKAEKPAAFGDFKVETIQDDAPRPVPRPRPVPPRDADPRAEPEPGPKPPDQGNPPLRRFAPRALPVLACAWSGDGKLFATGHGDKLARLWDGASGDLKQTFAGHGHAVRAVAISADGSLVATGSDDKTIRIWDCAGGQCLKTLKGHQSYVSAVAFLPDGRLFSASADGTAALWNLETLAQEVVLRGHLRGIEDACVSADGRFALTASWDGTARLWDLAEGKDTLCINLGRDTPLCVALAPDSASLAVGTTGGKLRIYDARSGESKREFHGNNDVRSILKVAFTGDGKTLLRCGGDNEIRAYDVETGKARAHTAPQGLYRCLASMPDNKTFAVGSHGGEVCAWELK